MTYVCDPGRIF